MRPAASRNVFTSSIDHVVTVAASCRGGDADAATFAVTTPRRTASSRIWCKTRVHTLAPIWPTTLLARSPIRVRAGRVRTHRPARPSDRRPRVAESVADLVDTRRRYVRQCRCAQSSALRSNHDCATWRTLNGSARPQAGGSVSAATSLIAASACTLVRKTLPRNLSSRPDSGSGATSIRNAQPPLRRYTEPLRTLPS